ncbi:MAG: prolyl oligopeptidase family serine peptidase [Rhodothermales bacterium]|nr:prolyl oligopeptidase family serine peptidase [Rhodothermales bacterium]
MIMQDQDTWVGASPGQPFWTVDGEDLFVMWNPMGSLPADSLFVLHRGQQEFAQASPERRRTLPPRFSGWHHGEHRYDATWNRIVYADGGDLYLYDRAATTTHRLTQTRSVESEPRLTPDGLAIRFAENDNLYRLTLATGAQTQLTDLRPGSEPPKNASEDDFLTEQQQALFAYIREDAAEREAREAARRREEAARRYPPVFYTGNQSVRDLQIDPTERFVTFSLWESDAPPRTSVMNFVTESGHAEELSARSKVGETTLPGAFYVQDLTRDTTYRVDLHQLPGAYDLPAYRRAEGAALDSAAAKRSLYPSWATWSGDGRYAVMEIRASDNKDRWIARLHPETGMLSVLDRQTDDAWIAGPGIQTHGWLTDNRHLFFQSERTGYSHLYTVDVETGTIEALTAGTFEVFNPMLSRDGTTWFFTSSEGTPFERHFYTMPAGGGTRTRLTTIPGNNEVALAPDERTLAIRHSYSNKPPEIYLTTPGADARPITRSTTEAWKVYPWRDPEIIHIDASDGARVPARIYRPEQPNGGAVLFVHGAGYLQNVHRWWSSYQREYMFHNLLADHGYLVLDVDYRGSAGYGRNWRTAIYRHMGGRDLQDFVDASRYAQSAHGIDPERVFIYGGSYGGFITLMALFTEPEHFGGGAALRSVTDWAHYNHPYTANILNTPATDSLAYARSSPIYFAEGLADPLLIAHGMVDTNVHFQDVVRLAQRLIELGKTGWEMAVYPVENHGFTEPASWTDEYRRILELIEESVGPQAHPPAHSNGSNDN